MVFSTHYVVGACICSIFTIKNTPNKSDWPRAILENCWFLSFYKSLKMNYSMKETHFFWHFSKIALGQSFLFGVFLITEGPRLTRKTGPGKTPRYAKSRCARLLLCSKCPTESPKPRETEESVLGEVTTV